MTTWTQDNEAGTNGSNVAPGSAGSGTDFDNVSIGSLSTFMWDNSHPSHGSLAIKCQCGTTSTSAYGAWTAAGVLGSAQSVLYGRACLTVTSTPSAAVPFCRGLVSSANAFRVLLTSTGKISMQNASNAQVATGTITVPSNTPFRVEWQVSAGGTGAWALKWFSSVDSTTPDETFSGTSNFGAGNFDEIRWGIGAAFSNVGPYWLDDQGLSNVGFLGPAVSNVSIIDLASASVAAQATEFSVIDQITLDAVSAALGATYTLETVQAGVSVGDTPSASLSGLLSESAVIDQILADSPSGSLLGSTSENVTINVAISDAASAALGTALIEPISVDMLVGDVPMAALEGLSLESATSGVDVADTASGSVAGSPVDTLAIDILLAADSASASLGAVIVGESVGSAVLAFDAPNAVVAGNLAESVQYDVVLVDGVSTSLTGALPDGTLTDTAVSDGPTAAMASLPADAVVSGVNIADQPAAAVGGSSASDVASGVTLPDLPLLASLGGNAPDATVADLAVEDFVTASLTGCVAETVSFGSVALDSPSALLGALQAETLEVDSGSGDTPSGGMGANPTDTTTIDVFVADTAYASVAGLPAESVGNDVIVPDANFAAVASSGSAVSVLFDVLARDLPLGAVSGQAIESTSISVIVDGSAPSAVLGSLLQEDPPAPVVEIIDRPCAAIAGSPSEDLLQSIHISDEVASSIVGAPKTRITIGLPEADIHSLLREASITSSVAIARLQSWIESARIGSKLSQAGPVIHITEADIKSHLEG